MLSSTDAAAVFSVLRGVGVKPRLAAALELESGLNDAPVVIAVILLAGTDPITWLTPLLVVYELDRGRASSAARIGWSGRGCCAARHCRPRGCTRSPRSR